MDCQFNIKYKNDYDEECLTQAETLEEANEIVSELQDEGYRDIFVEKIRY